MKTLLGGEFTASNASVRKEDLKINPLIFYLRKLEKERQLNPK